MDHFDHVCMHKNIDMLIIGQCQTYCFERTFYYTNTERKRCGILHFCNDLLKKKKVIWLQYERHGLTNIIVHIIVT